MSVNLPTPNERAAVVIPLRLTGGRTIEVALDRPCSACRGTGLRPNLIDCPECAGDGYVPTANGERILSWVGALEGRRFGRPTR